MGPLHGVGDEVVVLGRLERHGHAGSFAELARPHAGGVHDDLGLDGPSVGDDAGHASSRLRDSCRRHVLEDPGATHPGALRVGHRQVGRVDPAVLGDVERGKDVVRLRRRPHPPELGGGDLLVVHAEAAGEGSLPAEGLEPPWRGRHGEVADGAEAGRLAGLGLDARTQLPRVARHPDERLGRHAGRRDEPRRMPRRPGGELAALQEDDVPPAELHQVVGDARADHASAHDDGAGAVG